MKGTVISLTERRLERQAIKITFFKAILRQSAVELRYPGGLVAFLKCYKAAEQKAGLIAVTFMSLQQQDKFVATMKYRSVLLGRDFALANQIDGVVNKCSGIEFLQLDREVNTGATIPFSIWYARAAKKDSPVTQLH